MKEIKLKNGNQIPALGLGTYKLKGKECTKVVKKALEIGYRHLDTADMYNNHQAIAPALEQTDIDREELFITSKLKSSDLKYDRVKNSLDRFLNELNTDYLDLLLIHWPNPDIPIEESLSALKELQQENKIKNIGVSNFTQDLLQEALNYYPDLITVNQVEFHPTLYQKKLLEFSAQNNVILTAYSPLGRGQVFNNPSLKSLAEKYDKSPAQLTLRWMIEKDIVVIPKASSEAHLKNNFDIFNWDFPEEAARAIDDINQNNRLINPGYPDFD